MLTDSIMAPSGYVYFPLSGHKVIQSNLYFIFGEVFYV